MAGLLKLDDEETKHWVILALGESKNPNAIDPLIQILEDKSNSQRVNGGAQQSLYKIINEVFGSEQRLGADASKWKEWWENNKAKLL